ncbi:DUF6415 family natural product biosynthesis protein [Streptomyces massasporeus]
MRLWCATGPPVLVPEAELASLALSEDSAQRACALHCVGDARTRMSVDPGRTPSARLAQAHAASPDPFGCCAITTRTGTISARRAPSGPRTCAC